MPLQSNLDVTLRWSDKRTLDLSAPVDSGAVAFVLELLDGVGLNQNDKIFHDRRTLVATSESLDLAAVLTSAFGEVITFAKIKAILIKNRQLEVGRVLLIGGAPANAFPLFSDVTDKYPLGPDGVFLLWEPSLAGKPVTPATGDLLKIDAGANTVTYDIVLIGTSA